MAYWKVCMMERVVVLERVRGTKGGTVLSLRYLRKAGDAKGSKGQEKKSSITVVIATSE